MVFEQLRAGVVHRIDRKPVVGVCLLDAIVGCEPVVRIVIVFHVLLKVGNLLAFEGAIELLAKLLEPIGNSLSHCEGSSLREVTVDGSEEQVSERTYGIYLSLAMVTFCRALLDEVPADIVQESGLPITTRISQCDQHGSQTHVYQVIVSQ
jgi:hypothetical protein